jgi:hypothetical protein
MISETDKQLLINFANKIEDYSMKSVYKLIDDFESCLVILKKYFPSKEPLIDDLVYVLSDDISKLINRATKFQSAVRPTPRTTQDFYMLKNSSLNRIKLVIKLC